MNLRTIPVLTSLFAFTLATQLARASTFPANSPFPFRAFYPAPMSSAPGEIDDDLIARYRTEVQATAQSAPAGSDRATRLAHQFARFSAENRKVLETLEARARAATADRPTAMDLKQIGRTLKAMRVHPVVGSASDAKYGAQDHVGYCFGRAAYVHLKLSLAGLPQTEMVKLFALGKLRHTHQLWDFHVATAVLAKARPGAARAWWVVDSLFSRPLPVEDWFKRVAQFSVLKRFSDVRFYATDPRKFLPVTGEYTVERLADPIFKGYFEDLYQSLRR